MNAVSSFAVPIVTALELSPQAGSESGLDRQLEPVLLREGERECRVCDAIELDQDLSETTPRARLFLESTLELLVAQEPFLNE